MRPEISVTARDEPRRALSIPNLHVTHCSPGIGEDFRRNLVWEIVDSARILPPPTRFRVGEVPLGWRETVPVELPLESGCYYVSAIGLTGSTRMIVNDSGQVQELPFEE